MRGRTSSGYAPRQEATEILRTSRHELLLGITATGVVHLAGDNPDVDTRFASGRHSRWA
jgi:hypothetical protein